MHPLSAPGTDNTNDDFPVGDTVLGGLRAALVDGKVDYSPEGTVENLAGYDAIIAVLSETPYAEKRGDIPPDQNLSFSRRFPDQATMLTRLAHRGVPVVVVLLSGRPAYINDLLNASSSVVVAWLPGTEAGGVADLLVRSPDPARRVDFTGTLAYSWPRQPCQQANLGDGGEPPLFAPGYGITYARPTRLGRVKEGNEAEICVGAGR